MVHGLEQWAGAGMEKAPWGDGTVSRRRWLIPGGPPPARDARRERASPRIAVRGDRHRPGARSGRFDYERGSTSRRRPRLITPARSQTLVSRSFASAKNPRDGRGGTRSSRCASWESTHSLDSSVISSFFCCPVAGFAMLSCGGKGRGTASAGTHRHGKDVAAAR